MDDITLFTPELALDLWYEALKHETGLIVPIIDTADVLHIQQQLYQARADMKDPRLANLSIHINKAGTEISIYNRGVELDP